jgi:hypothetical protein
MMTTPECPRCEWLQSLPDADLSLFVFLPHRASVKTREREGQRLRAIAIERHTATGHEDLDRDRVRFTRALRVLRAQR